MTDAATDVLIAGGGLAGAAAACRLAQAGQRVVLLEREAAPRPKVCGEFLSVEACAHLAALGISLAALGAAPVGHVRLVHGETVVGVALPFPAAGLSRARLDEALLRQAVASGAQVRRGRAVRGLAAAGPGLVLDGGDTLRAPLVLLATGKHELRGMRRRAGGRVGLKTHWRLARAQRDALDGHVELLPFAGGYVGLQPVEEGIANLCLLVDAARLQRAGGWDGLLAELTAALPHLRRRLAGAEPLQARPVAVAGVPCGFLYAPAPADPDWLFRLGDQAAVIPPFCGDGMAMALHGARGASAALLAGGDARAWHRRFRHDVAGQMRTARAIDLLASSAAGRAALGGAARWWPDLLAWLASATRVAPARDMAGLLL